MCKELWYVKAACKILVKLTVIPKFFAQLLSGFVIFWRKDFGAKAAHKMLVKLTPALIMLAEQNDTLQNDNQQNNNDFISMTKE